MDISLSFLGSLFYPLKLSFFLWAQKPPFSLNFGPITFDPDCFSLALLRSFCRLFDEKASG